MDILITINTDNSAFDNNAPVVVGNLLLVQASKFMDKGIAECDGDHLMDVNGNTVGYVEVLNK